MTCSPKTLPDILARMAEELDQCRHSLQPIEAAILAFLDQSGAIPKALVTELQGIDRLDQRLGDLGALSRALAICAPVSPDLDTDKLRSTLRLAEIRIGLGLESSGGKPQLARVPDRMT